MEEIRAKPVFRLANPAMPGGDFALAVAKRTRRPFARGGTTMTKKLDGAIDSIGERVTHICEFLHEIEPGKPVDKEALDAAMHDCSNVSQSMSSLKRVVSKLEDEK